MSEIDRLRAELDRLRKQEPRGYEFTNKFLGQCFTLDYSSLRPEHAATASPLYAAPKPAQAPEKMQHDIGENDEQCGYVKGWNACRDAMLAAAKEDKQ